jgi:hypothetical protein
LVSLCVVKTLAQLANDGLDRLGLEDPRGLPSQNPYFPFREFLVVILGCKYQLHESSSACGVPTFVFA